MIKVDGVNSGKTSKGRFMVYWIGDAEWIVGLRGWG